MMARLGLLVLFVIDAYYYICLTFFLVTIYQREWIHDLLSWQV